MWRANPTKQPTNPRSCEPAGASEGKGLGNKFLDDLRQADILLHIIDVSGTTNEKVRFWFWFQPLPCEASTMVD
jgi:hypothetical protein